MESDFLISGSTSNTAYKKFVTGDKISVRMITFAITNEKNNNLYFANLLLGTYLHLVGHKYNILDTAQNSIRLASLSQNQYWDYFLLLN